MLCRFIPNDYCNKIEIEYKKMFKKSDMNEEIPLESLAYRTISSDVDIACMISPNDYYESLLDAKLLWVNTYISGDLYCFRISPDFQTVKFVQPNKTHIREYFSREDLSYTLSELHAYRGSIKKYCPIEYYNQFIDYLDRALKSKGIYHNNMAYVGRLDLDQYTYVNDLVKFDDISPIVAPIVEPIVVIQSPPIIEPVVAPIVEPVVVIQSPSIIEPVVARTVESEPVISFADRWGPVKEKPSSKKVINKANAWSDRK